MLLKTQEYLHHTPNTFKTALNYEVTEKRELVRGSV